MKRINSIIASLLTFIFVLSPVQAQEADNSVLFKVSGNGLKAPSYIMGSFHYIDGRTLTSFPHLDEVYGQVEQCCFETDMDYVPTSADSTSQQAQPQMQLTDVMLPYDSTYTKILGAEKAKVISSLMSSIAQSTGIPDLKPAFAKQIIQAGSLVRMLGLTMELASTGFQQMDYFYHSKAKSDGKLIAWLESPETQQAILNKMAEQKKSQKEDDMVKQMNDLYDYCVGYEKSMETYDRIHAAYHEGKGMDVINNLLQSSESNNSVASLMNVDERNAAWVAKMPDMLKAHPTLFIVGLAHLLPYHGAEGIVERLRKLGYEVTPMN